MSSDGSSSSRRQANNGSPRIMNMSDLIRSNDPGDAPGENRHNEYFAGGTRSGLAIEGPDQGRPGDAPADLRSMFLQHAYQNQVQASDTDSAYDSQEASTSFTGTSYRLGLANGSPSMSPSTSSQGALNAQSEAAPQSRRVYLLMYTDGFGFSNSAEGPAEPLHSFADEASHELLQVVMSGRIPRELLPRLGVAADSPTLHTDIQVVTFNHPAPTPPAPKFAGTSLRLGSAGGADEAAANSIANTTDFSSPAEISLPAGSPGSFMVRVRLASGSNLTVRLNDSHTVLDLYNHIRAVNSDSNQRRFMLKSTLPGSDVVADIQNVTVKGAGWAGSTLAQSWL
ncbi:hypothetical protein H696_04395 [Fonticula alba]|uniref:UBX domain-containing protein n=1 Tax=Fonticula alba TaxID=691883 RepID=A0A058Z414_FONAL|nr:hypothetical protein H696_04395 [Fonticula alba]KCV68975.1 hypothetical protein H696_04395 [Fonticula alba]|eukprot:XP_009496546.1 hypothetical protein H696_04395 [Fonticula alba]